MPATEEQVVEKETGDKGKGGETVTMPKAEWDRHQRELNETRQSERAWSERALRGGKREEPEPEEESGVDVSDIVPEVTGNEDVDQAIFNDPEKWVAAVAKGPAAIEALIRKGGYVTGKQAADIAARVARRTVNETTSKLSADNRFISRYSDLQNPDSELFKATKIEYNEMLAEMTPEEREEAKRSPLTLRAATRTAAAGLKFAKAAKPKADDDGDEYEYDRVDPEEERRHRVKSQDGSRGGRGGGGEEESRIGPQQRMVLEGMGVSEDKFRTSEKNIGSARRRKAA